MWFGYLLAFWLCLMLLTDVGGFVYTLNVKPIVVGAGSYVFAFIVNLLTLIGVLVYFL